MKNIAFTTIFLIFLIASINAQENAATLPEFGQISMDELRLKDCIFSPGASAVNLLKYKEVELSIFPNGTTEVVTKTRYRTKIFNRNGYKNATITFPFYGDNTIKTKNIQAATYNLGADGNVSITKVKDEDIFKDKGTKKEGRKSISFTFPDLKEGSVIEYQIVRKYKMAYDVPSWYFQDDIPNALTVYKVIRQPLSNLVKRVVSNMPIEETHQVDESKGPDKKQLQDIYIVRNVPAFESEVFMSSSRDYKYRIDFLLQDIALPSSNGAWLVTNARLLRSPYFGGAFNLKIPGTKAFIDSVKQFTNVQDKIRLVYGYVKQKLKWVGVYAKYARELDEVWKEGEGTSAEINLSLLNLLRKSGVQCFPVLYSTRSNGKADFAFPDVSQFNTVNIAVVNGKKFNLLDGTNPYLSYETPPYNVVNRSGMLIDPINQTKINIDFDRKLIWDSVFVSASIDLNGVLKGNVVKKYFDLSKSMKLQESVEEDDDSKSISQTEPGMKADTIWQENKGNELLPLIERTTFRYEMPTTNDFYFLNPFLFSDLKRNPFTDTTRISDIDFGAATASVVQMEIALPKEIKLEDLPKDKAIYSADSSINFVCHNEIKNDTINVTSSFEVKKPIFEKSEYKSLKEVFEKIYNQLNNQILLQRKKD